MRSTAELTFRVRQELANLALLVRPPTTSVELSSPLPGLPDPAPVVEQLRNTEFCGRILQLAADIEQHRIPLTGGALTLPHRIDWRRDYRHDISSALSYFRLVPYLDFHKVGDHKVVWDLNRHQHLIVLAQAFLFTGRQDYLATIQQHVESWLDDNPYLRGINWTSALEVGFRALSWAWVIHLVGAQLEHRVRQKLISALFQHGCYVEHNLSIYFSPNTHLLGEAVSLHALGALFPKFPRSALWTKLGGDVVQRQMTLQVRDDGSHFEQSSYYHVYALDLFLFHEILSETTPGYRLKLRLMAKYLAALMGQSRTLPLIGDDDGGRVFHPYGPCDRFGRATLATCALLLEDVNGPWEAADVHEQAAWWLGAQKTAPRELARDSAPAAWSSHLFPNSGVAVLTSGTVQVLADAGVFGPGSGGHSHSDTLAVVVRDGMEEVLSDSGTYTYVADPRLRNWFRGSIAHNTIGIDRRDQAVPAGPFRWIQKPGVEVCEWTSVADYDLLDALCRYGDSGLTHRRRVLLLKCLDASRAVLLIVCDTISGVSGTHNIEQFWHPSQPITPETPNRYSIGSRNQLLIPEGDAFETAVGWRSSAFGSKSEAPMLIVRRESTLPTTMWAVLCLGVSVQSVQVDETTPERAAIEVSNGARVMIDFSKPAARTVIRGWGAGPAATRPS